MDVATLKAAIESALNDPRNFPWLLYLCILIFSAAGTYLGSYFIKKAENKAIKEDITTLTNLVEKVKAQFERLNAIHRVQFEAAFAQPNIENYTLFIETHAKFLDALEESRPFVPPSIIDTFSVFDDLMVDAKARVTSLSTIEDTKRYRLAASDALRKSADAIRTRLSKLLVLE